MVVLCGLLIYTSCHHRPCACGRPCNNSLPVESLHAGVALITSRGQSTAQAAGSSERRALHSHNLNLQCRPRLCLITDRRLTGLRTDLPVAQFLEGVLSELRYGWGPPPIGEILDENAQFCDINSCFLSRFGFE